MASWGDGLGLWARFGEALRVLSPLASPRAPFQFFLPHPWLFLPLSAKLGRAERLHSLVCTRPGGQKNPALDPARDQGASVRRPASLPEHSTHATALIRPYSSRTQNFSGRDCVPAAHKTRVCSHLPVGCAVVPRRPTSTHQLDRALGASSAAHQPGRRRVGSAPRADRFSDSVRPRSAPG